MGFLGKIIKGCRFRILLALAILFSVFLLPWWLSAVLVLVGIFLFSFYWEALVAVLIFDLLYSSGRYPFLIAWGTFWILLIFLGHQFFFKKRLRWFNEYH